MKIAIIIQDYVKGGQNVFIAELINSWPEPDEFVIISNEENCGLDLIRYRVRKGCKIITHKLDIDYRLLMQTPEFLQPLRKLVMAFGRYLTLVVQTVLICRTLKEHLPNVVVISNGGYPGGQICRAAAFTGMFGQGWGQPIMICHNTASQPSFWQRPFEAIVDLFVCHGVSDIVAVSRHTEKSLRVRLGSRADSKLRTIYNGIDPGVEIVSDGAGLAKLGIASNSKLILTIANFEKRKGHEFLFCAFSEVQKKLPRAVLLLAGSGTPQRTAELKDLAQQLNCKDKIYFLGHVDDIHLLVSNIDILAVPSQEYESFGLIALEAMAQRKAVVATDAGGLPEVVEDGVTGFICPRLEINSFAGKIIELLSNDSMRKNFGNAGFSRLQALFLGSRMANDYYQMMVRTHPNLSKIPHS